MGCFSLVHYGNPNPNRSQHQTRAQRKRVAAEKEEQRSECALTFQKKSEQAIQSLLRRGAGVHNGLNKNRSLRSSQRQAASAGLKLFNNTAPV